MKRLLIGYLIKSVIWVGVSFYFYRKMDKKVKGTFSKCKRRKVKVIKAEWTVV